MPVQRVYDHPLPVLSLNPCKKLGKKIELTLEKNHPLDPTDQLWFHVQTWEGSATSVAQFPQFPTSGGHWLRPRPQCGTT